MECFAVYLLPAGRDIIDWVWREELGKWHSEQESKLDTYGLEVSGGYTTTGFLHRISVSYGYIHTSKVDRVITSSALDYMKHKAAATVEFRFLRNCSLTLTGAVYDRNGSYTYYLRNADGSLMLDPDGKMMTEVRDFKPYFLLDGRLSWEKKGWKLYFDVMNMTDTRYFDFGGLEMPGVLVFGRYRRDDRVMSGKFVCGGRDRIPARFIVAKSVVLWRFGRWNT